MPTHVIKNTDSHLVLKVISEATYIIDLSDGEKNGKEPLGYYINGLQWTQNPSGNIKISRDNQGSDEISYDLYGSGSFNFYGKSDNHNSNSYVKITSNNSYTLLIELKKIV